MTIEQDLNRITLQEDRLQFTSFDANTAWKVGTRLRELAEARGQTVAIDIQLNRHQLFFTAMSGTSPDNIDWIRRKVNVVNRFHRSSYAIGLRLQKDGTTLSQQVGVADADYAPHGGCFPIRLRGSGCVGTITVSGLPQRADHALVVEVLAEFLEQPLSELALD
jgi:uncharacterized protein (UPF0303 family)